MDRGSTIATQPATHRHGPERVTTQVLQGNTSQSSVLDCSQEGRPVQHTVSARDQLTNTTHAADTAPVPYLVQHFLLLQQRVDQRLSVSLPLLRQLQHALCARGARLLQLGCNKRAELVMRTDIRGDRFDQNTYGRSALTVIQLAARCATTGRQQAYHSVRGGVETPTNVKLENTTYTYAKAGTIRTTRRCQQ
jgi:hypothetical protein